MHRAGRELLLADLRAGIARLEGGPARRHGALPFGVAALDRHLPGGGLALGALHEFAQDGMAAEHAGLATLFVAGVLARHTGPVIWCLRHRDLFQAGLASVGLMGVRGRVQKAGQVVHVVTEYLTDLSGLLRTVGERDEAFPLRHGRVDEACGGSGPALGRKARDIFIPDLPIDGGIKVKARDFR